MMEPNSSWLWQAHGQGQCPQIAAWQAQAGHEGNLFAQEGGDALRRVTETQAPPFLVRLVRAKPRLPPSSADPSPARSRRTDWAAQLSPPPALQ